MVNVADPAIHVAARPRLKNFEGGSRKVNELMNHTFSHCELLLHVPGRAMCVKSKDVGISVTVAGYWEMVICVPKGC